MKKFIIIKLSFLVLVLISCENDQKKCEGKGKVWIAEESKCIITEQKECEVQPDMTWNTENSKCEEKSPAQVKCEAQSGMIWNTENSKCEKEEATSTDNMQLSRQSGERQADKKWENSQCVDQQKFTITWTS